MPERLGRWERWEENLIFFLLLITFIYFLVFAAYFLAVLVKHSFMISQI